MRKSLEDQGLWRFTNAYALNFIEGREDMKKRINIIVCMVTGIVTASITLRICNRKLKEQKALSDKHLALFKLMELWISKMQEGKSVISYFHEKGYKNVAIYGMHYVGACLYKELLDSDVKVKYGIDKRKDNVFTDLIVYSLEDELEEVDAVIVTPIFFFDEIKQELGKIYQCPIISIEDILDML